jgi:sugar lactone lactonase YvrE
LGATKAKLFQLDAQGRSKTLAELDGFAIQAIAIDRQDRVYAATSPDGKVYRVDSAGKAEIFYDPKQKYIWALAFARSGDLFVATGDSGEIHRVTPAGAGSVFFRTEETHARSLAVDAQDNLIVGTDPSGLILRVTPAGPNAEGNGFVVYQSAKREITALAVATDGSIYAAGVGNKLPAAPIPPAPAPTPAPAPPAGGGTTIVVGPPRPATTPPPTLGTAPSGVSGGSEIYRVFPDGHPRKVWNHATDVVYALAVDERGHVIAGSGNHGAIYRLDSDSAYTRLLNLAPTQVTAFCAAPGGKLFAVSGNIGKVFSIGPELESQGTVESDVFDAGSFTYWGRLTFDPEGATGVKWETRSGNLSRAQKNWSPWAALRDGRVASPAARFLQYRMTLSAAAKPITEIDIAYQSKNVAPVIEDVEATPSNYKFPAPSIVTVSPQATLTLPPIGQASRASSGSGSDSGSSPTLNWAKGHIGARWKATDENGDTLLFKLEIRGVNETAWKLLRDKIRERYYSWDSTAYPDGKYVVRVTASDAPSNPPDQALSAQRESDPFLIDNTPPEIRDLRAAPASAGKIEVSFRAKDALSTLGKAEYSINGGDWTVVEPTTRLTDSEEHEYRVTIDRPAGEVTVAVRVSDEHDNEAVAKTVLR